LSFDEIIIVGGGAKATLLNQYIANVLGIKVIAGDPEATTLGNALIQFISHREIEDLTKAQEILRNSVNEKIYYPQDQELWNDKYHQFLNVNKLN
jgi:rhamnulokinase